MPYLVGQMKAVPTYIGFCFILKPAWRNNVFARIYDTTFLSLLFQENTYAEIV